MYVQTLGTRAQVWHGTAKKTSGGLTKNNLMKNKAGRIVSKAKHNTAKREMRLVKYGYGTKKGEFGMVKLEKSKGRKSRRNKSRKMRGGIKPIPQMRGGSGLMPLTPADIDAMPMDQIEVLDQSGGVGLNMKKGGSRSMLSPADINDIEILDQSGGMFGSNNAAQNAAQNAVRQAQQQAMNQMRTVKQSGGRFGGIPNAVRNVTQQMQQNQPSPPMTSTVMPSSPPMTSTVMPSSPPMTSTVMRGGSRYAKIKGGSQRPDSLPRNSLPSEVTNMAQNVKNLIRNAQK
jgi:hypothetical protein